jgi:hypothetical protein
MGVAEATATAAASTSETAGLAEDADVAEEDDTVAALAALAVVLEVVPAVLGA